MKVKNVKKNIYIFKTLSVYNCRTCNKHIVKCVTILDLFNANTNLHTLQLISIHSPIQSKWCNAILFMHDYILFKFQISTSDKSGQSF